MGKIIIFIVISTDICVFMCEWGVSGNFQLNWEMLGKVFEGACASLLVLRVENGCLCPSKTGKCR